MQNKIYYDNTKSHNYNIMCKRAKDVEYSEHWFGIVQNYYSIQEKI